MSRRAGARPSPETDVAGGDVHVQVDSSGISRERAHGVPVGQQPGEELRADEAAGAGDEDAHAPRMMTGARPNGRKVR